MSFLGGAKSILRGAIVENFFALRANLFFTLRAKDLAPPQAKILWTPLNLVDIYDDLVDISGGNVDV